MTFADKFREKYRVALYAARANNQDATLAGLVDLYRLFAEQYALDNGDSIVVKAKLSYWQEIFGGYVDIIRKNGLCDKFLGGTGRGQSGAYRGAEDVSLDHQLLQWEHLQKRGDFNGFDRCGLFLG